MATRKGLQYGSRAGHGLLIYHACLFCNSVRGPWNSVTELFCFGIMLACRLVVSRVLRKSILYVINLCLHHTTAILQEKISMAKFVSHSICQWSFMNHTDIQMHLVLVGIFGK